MDPSFSFPHQCHSQWEWELVQLQQWEWELVQLQREWELVEAVGVYLYIGTLLFLDPKGLPGFFLGTPPSAAAPSD
jgi:hypothetical protein